MIALAILAFADNAKSSARSSLDAQCAAEPSNHFIRYILETNISFPEDDARFIHCENDHDNFESLHLDVVACALQTMLAKKLYIYGIKFHSTCPVNSAETHFLVKCTTLKVRNES